MAVLEVKGLSKHFDDLEVIRDVGFSIEKGESLAIIGSSGSGKTTLLRCLNGLEAPDAGRILVNGSVLFDAQEGRNINRERRRKSKHFGLVFQSFNLFPQYTALANVVLAVELAAKKRPDYASNRRAILEQIREDGLAILESVGLTAKADVYPHQLSGGQQQRVAIARALAGNPTMLLADEPTGALDQETGKQVLSLFREINSEGRTVIMITHDLNIANFARRIVHILDGVLREGGKRA